MIVLRNLRHELADRRAAWTLCALFLLGLAIRLVFLNRAGTSDIDIDLQWGKDANTFGLPISYHGNYFPFQYQIFQIAAANGYPVSSLVVFKTINLIADVGVFVVLILLLRRWRLNVFYACLYWLHPYFIAMFWLGYVDVQFVFFIVLGLLALTRAVASSRLPNSWHSVRACVAYETAAPYRRRHDHSLRHRSSVRSEARFEPGKRPASASSQYSFCGVGGTVARVCSVVCS